MTTLARSLPALAKTLFLKARQQYRSLSIWGKLFVYFVGLLYTAIVIAFIVIGPSRIFQYGFDLGQQLKNMRLGWLILVAFAVLTSFPPLMGNASVLSISGFAWGLKGFLISGPGMLLGSILAFVSLRFFFRARVSGWTKENKKWQAMESVIHAKGLPLVILIRLCPIPWAYNNLFFSSIESVSLVQFVLATIILMPKFLLIVFIGSQVAQLSDGTTRSQMSTTAKVLDSISIVVSVAVAIGTGLFIWRTTEKKIRHMEEFSDETDRMAADVLDDAAAPLLHTLSSDSLVSLEQGEEGYKPSPLDEVLDRLTGRIREQGAPDADK